MVAIIPYLSIHKFYDNNRAVEQVPGCERRTSDRQMDNRRILGLITAM
jgi:hypothetical protein